MAPSTLGGVTHGDDSSVIPGWRRRGGDDRDVPSRRRQRQARRHRPAKISDKNYARYNDPVLDDLYVKQARALDVEERRKHLRAFERRLLDEEAHYLTTLQQHRIIPHSAKVKGWTVTPSHYLNNQLDTVWLAE